MPKAPKSEKMSKKEAKEFVDVNKINVPSTSITTDAPPTPKLWKHSFSSSIQVTEAYISKNWYQGGESNFNLVSDQLYNIEYDKPMTIFYLTLQLTCQNYALFILNIDVIVSIPAGHTA